MIDDTFDLNYKSDMVSPLQIIVKHQDLLLRLHLNGSADIQERGTSVN